MSNKDIYDSYKESGFVFTYSKHHISKSKVISKDELDKIEPSKINGEKMVILCKACGQYMNFLHGDTIFNSFYICPECGVKVRESTAYKQIERENIIFTEKYGDIYGYYNTDEVPDICQDCDGPYPQCLSTCKFFDEE